jgi:hypothetical protein
LCELSSNLFFLKGLSSVGGPLKLMAKYLPNYAKWRYQLCQILTAEELVMEIELPIT